LAAFFARRIRRLAPAFVAMALVTALAGYALLLPFEFREFGKSLIASTVYLSNIHFFREAGYFDTGADTKILLHTWSLAVEEQFYIVLPLIMALAARWLGLLRALLWAAFFASLLGALWILPRSQPAAFYLFPFRAWELLAGVLLAIEAHRRGFTFNAPAWVGAVGLACIAISVTLIPAGPSFPGAWAILPVLGSVLMIASGATPSALRTALCARPMVAVGLISYSLYLWHWPVFTLSSYALGPDMPWIWTAAFIALSFALAALSWRFVEQPFRKGGSTLLPVFVGGGAASAVLLAIGGVIFLKDGMIERFGHPLRTHIEASADFLQDWSRCTVPDTGPFAGIETCPIGPEGAPRVLVWGDSHVRALKEGLEQLAFETGTPALLIWRAGCPPLFGVTKSETAATPLQNEACTSANDQIQMALEQAPFDRTLLVGRWGYYAMGGGIGLDAHNRTTLRIDGASGAQDQQLAQGLAATVQALEAAGSDVTVLAPIPEIGPYDSRTVARLQAGLTSARAGTDQMTRTPRIEVETRAAPLQAVLTQLQTLDLTDRFCTAEICSAIHDGTGQYFDNNHLTNSAAIRIRDVFRPVFTGTAP